MSKHTPTQLHAIEFSGNWFLTYEPFYEGNNLLDADDVGEEQAKENAERMVVIWNAMEGLSNEQVINLRKDADLESEKRAVAWDIFKVKGGWNIAGYNESEKEDPMYIHVSGNKKRYSDLYQYFIENIYNK